MNASAIVVLTGAGISAESGIPTFRDALTGLWEKYRPEELATPEAFEANPKLVWDWYAWRREQVAKVEPNAGHQALARLERECEAHGVSYVLVTQNVDGLHVKAGSRRVLELHGNIGRVKCFAKHHLASHWDDDGEVPKCRQCGSLLRPDVVWFGERLPPDAFEAAVAAVRVCQVFLSVGTSTLVEPAASLPFLALEAGAAVIEVNLQATPLTPSASVSLRGMAGVVLPQLLEGP